MKVKSEKQRIRPTGETSIKKTTHRGCLMGELEIPQPYMMKISSYPPYLLSYFTHTKQIVNIFSYELVFLSLVLMGSEFKSIQNKSKM